MRALAVASLSLLALFGLGSPALAQSTISLTPQLAAVSGVRAFFITLRGDGLCKIEQDRIAAEMRDILRAANIKVVDRFDSRFPDLPIMEISIDAFSLGSTKCMWFGKVVLRANTTGAQIDGIHYFDYRDIWMSGFRSNSRSADDFSDALLNSFVAQLQLLVTDIARAKKMFPDL